MSDTLALPGEAGGCYPTLFTMSHLPVLSSRYQGRHIHLVEKKRNMRTKTITGTNGRNENRHVNKINKVNSLDTYLVGGFNPPEKD